MESLGKHQTENCAAIIDVGSNSVKLLVAEVADGAVRPLLQTGEQTRLGRGVFETGRLEQEAIEQTAFVAASFAKRARDLGVSRVMALATSAARDARNGQELVEQFGQVGIPLEIIDGNRESELVLKGVRSHAEYADGLLAVLDVGGGSTELLVTDDNVLRVQKSFQLGTVRLLEEHAPSDRPTGGERARLIEAIDEFLNEQLVPIISDVELPPQLVAAGGTPVFLGRIFLERDKVPAGEMEGLHLPLAEVQSLADRLWMMPLAQRQKLPGLPANRADVILIGVQIYEAILLRCGFAELRPTLRGVRYGALLEEL